MHEDIAFLADAEGAVGGLIFDGWIPPSIEVEDVTGGGQVEAGASGLEGKHKTRRSIVSLEIGDEGSAFFDWGTAVQDEAGPAEDAVEVSGEGACHFLKLGENERLFLAAGYFFRQFAEACEFPAVVRVEGVIAQPLARVIADLFEPHEEGEDQSASLDATGIAQFLGQVVHAFLIEGGLLAAQAAGDRQFCFIWEVGDDMAVSFQASQDPWLHQSSQWSVIGDLRFVDGFEVSRKFCRAAEQSGIKKVENRPEVIGAVFDGCPAQGDACGGLDFFDGSGLSCAWIFDGLGFVENDEAPRGVGEPVEAGGLRVGCDDEVDAGHP
jgi:hypothetical protein